MDFKAYKAAVFDLDGTLIRSKGLWKDIDRRFFERRGLTVPEDYCQAVSAMDFRAAAEYTKALLGLSDTLDSIMQEWHDMAAYDYANVIEEVEGMADFLRYLSGRGVRLGLATANSAANYVPVLKRLGVYGLFSAFATTEEVSRGKGFPDVYELACERLGASPAETIVFEDIPEGIQGAKLGGLCAAACLDECDEQSAKTLKESADLAFTDYRKLMGMGLF